MPKSQKEMLYLKPGLPHVSTVFWLFLLCHGLIQFVCKNRVSTYNNHGVPQVSLILNMRSSNTSTLSGVCFQMSSCVLNTVHPVC